MESIDERKWYAGCLDKGEVSPFPSTPGYAAQPDSSALFQLFVFVGKITLKEELGAHL